MTFYVEGISQNLASDAQVRRIGEYASLPEAIGVAQKAVDAFLTRAYTPGMDFKALFALYRDQGEHPFIFRDDDKTFNVPGFNHIQYAMEKAKTICGDRK